MNYKLNKRSSKFKYVVLLFILLGIVIGYSYLNQNIRITGTTEVEANTWYIHFKNIITDPNSVELIDQMEIDEKNTNMNFKVKLKTPGEFYKFNVDVVNEGSINARLEDISITELTNSQKKYMSYTVTYSDGTPINKNDKLEIGQTETITITIVFLDDITNLDLPDTKQYLDLSLELNYVQEDGNGTKVVHVS